MPSGLIEQDDPMGTRRDMVRDLVEMVLHGHGGAARQHQSGADAPGWADCSEQIGRLGPLVVGRAGPRAAPGPAPRQLILLADPRLVLEPDLDRRAGGQAFADRSQLGGEVLWDGPPPPAGPLD